jgi:catechol 2,3-dioxygenase-like lactoylglutathione lyase family enzyme
MSPPEEGSAGGPAQILHLDHFAIRTTRLQESIDFYCNLLGLQPGPRPELPVEGVWLYSGVSAIVHLVELTAQPKGEAADGPPPVSTRHVDHVALRAIGYEQTRERLTRAGLSFREASVPALNLRQLFLRDPNGIALELDFRLPPEAAGPAA